MSKEVIMSFPTEEMTKNFFNWFKIFGEGKLFMNTDNDLSENVKVEYTEPKSAKGYYQIKVEKDGDK